MLLKTFSGENNYIIIGPFVVCILVNLRRWFLHFLRPGSAFISVAPQAFLGSLSPTKGTIVFRIRKGIQALANGTSFTIFGAPQNGESSFWTSASVTWVSASDPHGSGLVWKIINPKGAASVCRDPDFDSFDTITWTQYVLAWDFFGISGASRLNMALNRNTSVLCSGWIDDGRAGMASNMNPVAIMANPIGTDSVTTPLFLFDMQVYDEPSSFSENHDSPKRKLESRTRFKTNQIACLFL